MTSVLNVDTIADKAGTGPVALTKQTAAKGFVSFQGTGTSAGDLVTVHDSQNTSSVTDIDTGRYRQNFTNSMSNDTYSPAGGTFDSGETGSGGHFIHLYTDGGSTMATGSLSVSTREHAGGSRTDVTQANITTHGDLA